MIQNSIQNQKELQQKAQIIHRMNDEELQQSIQQKLQLEELWALDQIKIKNLTKQLNQQIANNEQIQKQIQTLVEEKHQQEIQTDQRLQEQAKYYEKRLLEQQEEKNKQNEQIKSIKIELDQKNSDIEDKNIKYNKLNLEFEEFNNIHQNLLNQSETLKNQQIQNDIKIQKLVEFQKSMNSSLNFLSKKDESNGRIIENLKEKEIFFKDKFDQYRKKETELIIKISELMQQIKQLKDQENQLLKQEQMLQDQVGQNKRQINQLEVKIRELNDEIVRIKILQKFSVIGSKTKSEQFQPQAQQIKYTHIEQFDQSYISLSQASRQSLEKEEQQNSKLISKLDKQIIELQERLLFQEAYINKLQQQSRIQINKKEQEQYSKFNPFKVFFLCAAKCKLDVSKVQVKQ